jgi:hypothetical protein
LWAWHDAREVRIFAIGAGHARYFRGLAFFFFYGLVACVALTGGFTLTFLGALGSWHSSKRFLWLEVKTWALCSHDIEERQAQRA